MTWWPFSESVTIGLFSVFFGGGIAALINASVQKALKRSDIAAAGLTGVIGGYKTLTDQQQARIDALREELSELETECDRRIHHVEAEFKSKADECERQITHLENEIRRREDVWQRRITELERQIRGIDDATYRSGPQSR